MKLKFAAGAVLAIALTSTAHAAIVNVDLSGAATGTTIDGVGADFAQTFSGQTVAGTGVTGSPTAPLSLTAAGTITAASFNPGVSPTSVSLLSQPGNAAPLAMLLETDADSLEWTMGSGGGGTVFVDLYDALGAVVGTTSYGSLSGYAVFNLGGLGTFRGVQFRDNSDPAGLRFMNFSYNSVSTSKVPEPATLGLLGLGLLGVARARRQKAI